MSVVKRTSMAIILLSLSLAGNGWAITRGDGGAIPVRTLDRVWEPEADAWFPYRSADQIQAHLDLLERRRQGLEDRLRGPHPSLRQLDYEIGILRYQLGWLARCAEHAASCGAGR